MVNPQLLQYVRAQRAAGVSREEIIKALAGGGWSAQDAQEAFAAIEAPPPPAAPKPPPPPPPPVMTPPPMTMAAPRPITPPPATIQPLTTRMQPAAVMQPRPGFAPAKKRRVWPWLLLILIFSLGSFAGGAYAAVEYPTVAALVREVRNMIMPPTLQPVPQRQPDPAPVFEEPNMESETSTTTPPTTGGQTSTSTATTTGQN